jgi:deazaflavin-dependent oxidoreductase (nitroreductase family)
MRNASSVVGCRSSIIHRPLRRKSTMTQQKPRWWQALVRRLSLMRVVIWLSKRLLPHLDRWLLRLTNNRYSVMNLLTGLPVVTLTTAGAKSGQPRTVPLLAMEDGGKVILIASNFGQTRLPAWYHNLRANPSATVMLRGKEGTYVARQASPAEWERYWCRAVDLYAGYANYRRTAANRHIPIMILTPKEK